MYKRIFLSCIILLVAIISGCSSIKDSAGTLGQELIKPIKESADSVGYNLVKGMRESLSNDESKKQINKLADSIITNLGSNVNKQLTGIRDSLFNRYIANWLRNEILGEKTTESLVNLRNSVLDSYLKEYLRDITSRIGTDILNDNVMLRLSAARDTLIGNRTNQMLKALIDSSVISLTENLNKGINPLLKENLSFIEKNATWLIILIGIIALVIIWFIWQQKQKYLSLTKLLTYQISEVQDRNLKENIKNSISNNAKNIGIEDDLRLLLDKTGLLHK